MSRSQSVTCMIQAVILAALVVAGCSTSSQVSNTGGSSGYNASSSAAGNVIDLRPDQGPIPRKQPLSAGREESVRWKNSDDRGHTIRFTDWPFREPQQEIHVEPGQVSRTFHMYKRQDPGSYTYGVFPPVRGDPGLPGSAQTGSSGPPDPPDIRADP